MNIGIMGAGRLGTVIAEWCAQQGHKVAMASRRPERLGGLVHHLRGRVAAVPIAEAASFAEVVLFAPRWEVARETIELAAGGLDGKVVIDATNPPRGAARHESSGLEKLISWAPAAHWAKAFNTLSPEVLDRRRGLDPLLTEFVCTDHPDARVVARRFIRDLGFAPFFAGGSENARLLETGGPLQHGEIDIARATEVFADAVAAGSAARWRLGSTETGQPNQGTSRAVARPCS